MSSLGLLLEEYQILFTTMHNSNPENLFPLHSTASSHLTIAQQAFTKPRNNFDILLFSK